MLSHIFIGDSQFWAGLMTAKKYFFRFGFFSIKGGFKIPFWEDRWRVPAIKIPVSRWQHGPTTPADSGGAFTGRCRSGVAGPDLGSVVVGGYTSVVRGVRRRPTTVSMPNIGGTRSCRWLPTVIRHGSHGGGRGSGLRVVVDDIDRFMPV